MFQVQMSLFAHCLNLASLTCLAMIYFVDVDARMIAVGFGRFPTYYMDFHKEGKCSFNNIFN